MYRYGIDIDRDTRYFALKYTDTNTDSWYRWSYMRMHDCNAMERSDALYRTPPISSHMLICFLKTISWNKVGPLIYYNLPACLAVTI